MNSWGVPLRDRQAQQKGGKGVRATLPSLEVSSTLSGSPSLRASRTWGIRVPGGSGGLSLGSRTSPRPRGHRTHPRDGEGRAEVPAAHQAEAPGRRAAQGHGVGHRWPEPQPEPEPDTEDRRRRRRLDAAPRPRPARPGPRSARPPPPLPALGDWPRSGPDPPTSGGSKDPPLCPGRRQPRAPSGLSDTPRLRRPRRRAPALACALRAVAPSPAAEAPAQAL